MPWAVEQILLVPATPAAASNGVAFPDFSLVVNASMAPLSLSTVSLTFWTALITLQPVSPGPLSMSAAPRIAAARRRPG
jgi:hypothetical protein